MDIIAFFPNPELDYNPPATSTESLILTFVWIIVVFIIFYFIRKNAHNHIY